MSADQAASHKPSQLTVTSSLEDLRPDVTDTLRGGANPSEVYSLGRLLAAFATPGIDMHRLRDALSRSTLPEVVHDVCFAIAHSEHVGDAPRAQALVRTPRDDTHSG
jgi:hypothetical protein